MRNRIVVLSLLSLFLAWVACDIAKKSPTKSDNEDPAISSQPRDRDMVQDLQTGKYSFAIDKERGGLRPLDGRTIPEEEKELYKLFLEKSEIPSSGKMTGPKPTVSSALPDYWRYACWREVCYALSAYKYQQGAYGQSRRSYFWNNAWWLAGDWDYDGLGYGRGGPCKYFASRIVKRATGGTLPSGYDYANGDIGWCRPGDIIQKRTSTVHTAIVFTVLSRDGNGRATSIDVIDANYVGGMGLEMIARHYFPYGSWSLSSFNVW